MLNKSITIELRGTVSYLGPIDAFRKESILRTVVGVHGVRGRCTVECHVEGESRVVRIRIPWVSNATLNELDRVLRGMGAMRQFFASAANPIVTGVS